MLAALTLVAATGTGCAAVEQQVDDTRSAVEESLRGTAQDLLESVGGAAAAESLKVPQDDGKQFRQLRQRLAAVQADIAALLTAPQDLTASAIEALNDRLTRLQDDVQAQVASATGVSAQEQQAWTDLATAVGRTADQVQVLTDITGGG